jgi:valyl-tRNA synthetase
MLSASAKLQPENVEILSQNTELILQLAAVEEFKAGVNINKPPNAAVVISDTTEIYVHDVIDPQAERNRLEKKRQDVLQAKKAVEAKLKNENFVKKAKPEVVAQAKERLIELSKQLKTIEQHLPEL